jgi:hypothetical protein
MKKKVATKVELTSKKVDLSSLKTIYAFDIYYCGWECDSIGWIKEDEEGNRYIIMTDHGGERIAQTDDLRGLVKSYEKAIEGTEKALEFLNG